MPMNFESDEEMFRFVSDKGVGLTGFDFGRCIDDDLLESRITKTR